MSEQNKHRSQNLLVTLMTAGALISFAVGGCTERSSENGTHKVTVTGQQVSLPGGIGVLLEDKQVVLIPKNTENKAQYEKRLRDINVCSKEIGYTFLSIIDPDNKMAYDAAMMKIYPRMYGRMYNMLEDPVSSWASMQMSGAELVSRYTPRDLVDAMIRESANIRTL